MSLAHRCLLGALPIVACLGALPVVAYLGALPPPAFGRLPRSLFCKMNKGSFTDQRGDLYHLATVLVRDPWGGLFRCIQGLRHR